MPWEGTKADRNYYYYYYFCSVEIIPYLIGTLFGACSNMAPPLSAMVLYDLVWCQHGVSFSPLDGVKRVGGIS